MLRKNGIRFADRVRLINKIEKHKQFEYWEPRGNIYCLQDLNYNVLVLHIEFEGWMPNQIRIWFDRKNSRKRNIFRTSTPELLSLAVSSLSFDVSIGFSNKYSNTKNESKIKKLWFATAILRESVQRRSFFWSVFSCIRTEYIKLRTRKTPYLNTFYAVVLSSLPWLFSQIDFIQITKFWLQLWHVWIAYDTEFL